MEERNVGGIDDLFEQMQQDEIADAAEESGTIKPTVYAKMRGIFAQRVYAAIRNGRLESYKCACRSTVINLDEADTLFGFKK